MLQTKDAFQEITFTPTPFNSSKNRILYFHKLFEFSNFTFHNLYSKMLQTSYQLCIPYQLPKSCLPVEYFSFIDTLENWSRFTTQCLGVNLSDINCDVASTTQLQRHRKYCVKSALYQTKQSCQQKKKKRFETKHWCEKKNPENCHFRCKDEKCFIFFISDFEHDRYFLSNKRSDK